MGTINLYRMDMNRINQFKGELDASKIQKRKLFYETMNNVNF